MRITSGVYKGRKLPFSVPDGIRPTTDKNREMIFNILNNIIDYEDNVFLDLFAGSGIMSLEFLSRGVKKAILIDKNFKSISLIKKNFEHLKILQNEYEILKGDAMKMYLPYQDEVDIVYVDPPYYKNLYPKIIDSLRENLRTGTIIIIESPSIVSHNLLGFEVLKSKSISDTEFLVLEKS